MVPIITYNNHPVRIVRVSPSRNFIGDFLLTVRSLRTDQQWEAWEYELQGDYGVIRESVEDARAA